VVLRVDKEKGAFVYWSIFNKVGLSVRGIRAYLGYIDLSKRRVSPEDITKCEERYMKSKTVASIMRHVASKLPSGSLDAGDTPAAAEPAAAPAEPGEKESKKSRRARQAAQEDDVDEAVGGANEEERLEKLYDAVGWPLGKKYGHTYDAFKLALTYVLLLSSGPNISG